jgi:antitoxin component of MazEF toxin-antitoxin module
LVKAKIAKWGNSVALRVPKGLAEDLGLVPGKMVDLQKDGTVLAVETDLSRRKVPVYRLEDLLAQIKPGDVPPYEDWGILPSEWPEEDWSDIAPSDDEWEASKKEAEVSGAVPPRRRA